MGTKTKNEPWKSCYKKWHKQPETYMSTHATIRRHKTHTDKTINKLKLVAFAATKNGSYNIVSVKYTYKSSFT